MKNIGFLLFSGMIVLAGCAQTANQGSGDAAAAKPVATVNGVTISRDVYEYFAKNVAGKASTELTPEQRNQLLDNLVHAEIIAQQATKDGLDKKGETAAMLELSRLQLLEQASSENYLKDRKATEAELKAEYDAQVAALPKTQYKAHHILVKTEAEAQAAIARIKKGEKFETVARELSLDSSRANGGDLGDFFAPTAMVKPFGDAVVALKKGDMTTTPVKTEFGWHVIRLDDTRETAAPPFDSVKDRIEQIVQAKKFQAYGDELLKTAKLEKSL
jgi:peptidyl-prolyl cis-trans isomerase C